MFGSGSTSNNRDLVTVGVIRYRRGKLSFRRMMDRMRGCVRRVGAFFILRGLRALHGGKHLNEIGTLITDTLGVGPIVKTAPRKAVYRLSRTENVGGTVMGVISRVKRGKVGVPRGAITVARYGYPRETGVLRRTVHRGLRPTGVMIVSATNIDDVCTGSNNIVMTI